jgi:hypothetical protein
MFFYRPDYELQSALESSYAIMPTAGMVDELKRDYQAMMGMVIGEIPEFSEVLSAIKKIESQINA